MNAARYAGSRRQFLAVSLAAGGGLLIGFSLASKAQSAAPAPPPKPSAFVRVDRSGGVTLILPYVEMGQGACTVAGADSRRGARGFAECGDLESGARSRRVCKPAAGRADHRWIAFTARRMDVHASGGAAARVMLVGAAAQRWKVSADSWSRREWARAAYGFGAKPVLRRACG